MWTAILVLIVVLLINVFVWRFVARLWTLPHESANPPDTENMFARVKPRPKSGAGAVALEEPDDDQRQLDE